jgi:hypothetical protein
MDYDGVNNGIGCFSEINLQLEAMENNHEEMKSTQDDVIQGQKAHINNGGKIVGVYGIIKDCSMPLI